MRTPSFVLAFAFCLLSTPSAFAMVSPPAAASVASTMEDEPAEEGVELTVISPAIPEGMQSRWASLAAGLDKDPNSGASAAAGIGIARFQAQASSLAVQSCQNSGVTADYNCHVVYTFDAGCKFLATGTRKSTNDARYSMGNTAQDAYDACSQGGFRCNTKVLGTCL